MNITFLVGNGFDLRAGLKTGYRDFLQVYLQRKTDSPAVLEFQAEVRRNLDTWSDFELEMGKYTEAFSGKELSSFVEVMDDVRRQLMEYLCGQEAMADYEGSRQEIAEAVGEMICCFYKNLSREEQREIKALLGGKNVSVHRFHFINFNYTRVLDRCLAIAAEEGVLERSKKEADGRGKKIAKKFGRVLHIHGTTRENPLLGVNDERQIANREAAFDEWFQRRFIKPLSNEAVRGGQDRDAIRCIKGSRIICIFGMSLGKTDGSWWWTVCNWLKGDGSRRLILFAGDDRSVSPEKKQEILAQFFSAASLEKAKEAELWSLSRQIFVTSGKGLFDVPLVPGGEAEPETNCGGPLSFETEIP